MMLAAVPPPAANSVKTPTTSQAYLKGSHVRETKSLIAELCRQFYNLGWVYGTGGSITVKVHDDSVPKSDQLIIMSPSLRKKKKSKARVLRTNILAVQKERIVEEDMYLLSPTGSILFPPLPKSPKCSDFSPLFTKAYNRRNADAVLHSHGIESCLVTTIDPLSKKFRHKRIAGRHTTIKTHALNLNNEAGTTPRCVVLDIEGTTTPISFVTDVLFPYARENVRMHLEETYDTLYTQDDIKLLRSQVCDDLQNGVAGAILVPNDEAGKEEVIAALVANVEEMIKADRKITSLKQLQGHIWQTGFEKNELKGVVFDDVPQALERWHASGVKVYIYSSGSRLAQRLIFGYTNHGDLRKYLCGFFDTTVGNKKETKSYVEISEFLGVDKPSDILFVTDVFQEAVAAKTAGMYECDTHLIGCIGGLYIVWRSPSRLGPGMDRSLRTMDLQR